MHRSLHRTALAAALFVASLPIHATAGPIEDLARQAESAAKAGKHVEAFNHLRAALIQQWNVTPLGFRTVTFITDKPGGYGIYNAKPDNVFKPGETLVVYAEPVGFKWHPKDGLNNATIVADVMLSTGDGKLVAGQKNFGTFNFNSREQNTEVMTHLTVNFTGAPAGKYLLAVTYTDKVSGETAEFKLPFEIR
jgi:hypothetical protein